MKGTTLTTRKKVMSYVHPAKDTEGKHNLQKKGRKGRGQRRELNAVVKSIKQGFLLCEVGDL